MVYDMIIIYNLTEYNVTNNHDPNPETLLHESSSYFLFHFHFDHCRLAVKVRKINQIYDL